MWMMGYNDGCHDDITSFNGRKLLPLLPKPISSTTTNPQFICHYNHQLGVAEQNKLRESNNTPQVVVSSRWNPTPEQLRALEELYRRGTRTPSAEQIQNITAQLRRYGKIEGKNVFYWFQNHKARERQKRRRQMESNSEDQDQPQILSEKKELLGTSRTIYDEHITKNWVPSTNCSSNLTAEEYYGISSTQENVAKAGAESSTTEDELIQLRPELLQNRRSSFNNIAKNSTWQTTHLSYPPISTNNITHHNLKNTLPSSTTTPSTRSTTPVTTTIMDQKHQPIKAHDLMNYFITPSSTQNGTFNYFNTSFNTHDDDDDDDDDEEGGDQYLYGGDQSDQTLQLFPIRCGTLSEKDSDEMLSVSTAMNASCISSSTSPPQQFFEFLPLKN